MTRLPNEVATIIPLLQDARRRFASDRRRTHFSAPTHLSDGLKVGPQNFHPHAISRRSFSADC